VSRFLEDAERVLETANVAPAHCGMADMAILIDAWGGMRIVDAAGWRPEALEAHYGAKTVYQVTRTPGGVRVTGRSGGRSCVLESARPSPPPSAMPSWRPFSPALLTAY
jgi:hypothetical protein